MDLVVRDFQPISKWTTQRHLCKNGEVIFVKKDLTTNRLYRDESAGTIRLKSCLLALTTPLIHGIMVVANVFFRILKLITLANFWLPRDGEGYDLKGRIFDTFADIARIYTGTIAVIALELSAIFGIISPYDGRKMYASCERAQYNHWILAPCFQPLT